MTATNEDLHDGRPARLTAPVLSMLLGFAVTLGFSVHHLLTLETSWGPRGWQVLTAYAFNLLVVGAIWALSRLTPSRQKTAALSVLLGLAALLGFSATAAILKILAANNFVVFRFWGPAAWHTGARLAANLLIFAGAIWGLSRLKPWKLLKGPREPVSPTTRRTNLLFGLSGLISMLGVVALIHGANGMSGVFSNSPVSPGVAIFAITSFLLAMAIAWWWYYSADEHERRANDVGFLAGGGVFLTVTPVWWVASRAGLLPPPDAMILWVVTNLVMGIGWFWHRSR